MTRHGFALAIALSAFVAVALFLIRPNCPVCGKEICRDRTRLFEMIDWHAHLYHTNVVHEERRSFRRLKGPIPIEWKD